MATHPIASVIVIVYVPIGRFENVADVLTLVYIAEPSATVYGPFPPNGVTAIAPFDVHVVFVMVVDAFTPALIWTKGNVPHFGLMVDVLLSNVAQVLFCEASVQAR